MITNEQYRFLRNRPSFSHFPVEHFDQLAKEIRFRKIPREQIFFFGGDKREYLFVLHKGYARIEQYDQTGTFSYLDYIREGESFPFGDIFNTDIYHYTAIAVTDLEYFMVPMNLYEDLSKINPRQMLYLAKKLSNILRFEELRLRNAMVASASERVVQVLALLYWDICQAAQLNTLPFPIHIQEISRLAATTRETASQVLKRLKKENRIAYSHKKLTFLDIDFFLEHLSETR
ncbi:Crp/Fnr family transcriptional regulator [Streptococcus sp. X16XC17]|uniref:Crp/Fnr family transcriptional regulator n=1 Tax=unclassified Streptococcus TaxID=2608887 RepID=UPI00066FED1E|nr:MULTISPECIES: Crp/Fnr family transcriptional regulator [unclassified Streptococcus]TCD46667.1 Crp/Fnr family transcriptional regulator [Streptococcus sp. X16XC17]